MASFWDLLPAGLWPVQPFVWPPDPMKPAPGPQETEPPQRSAATAPAFGWAPAQAAAASAPGFGWATAAAAPASAAASSGATDPNAFLGLFPDAEALDPARSARLLENAQRAHAFALWAFAPPGPRPAQQIGDAAARPAGVPVSDAWPSRNAAALSADARGAFAANAAAPAVATDAAALPPNRADQSDAPVGNRDAVPAQAADAAQPPALAAASGNPNIERQGERIRAAAAARQPPPAFVRAAADRFAHGLRETPLRVARGVTDVSHEIYQAGADALHEMDEGLNPFSSAYRASDEREARARRTGTFGDALAAEWEMHKRHGRGLRGILELLGAPITGTARSVLGHALETLPGFTYEGAKRGVDQSLIGLGPGRGGVLRAPRLSEPPASSFMGSSQLNLDRAPYQPDRNAPGELRGVPYSGHALDQMQDRGLPPIVADQAIQRGIPSPGKEFYKIEFYDPVNGVILVRNRYTGNVITVMRSRRGKGLPDDPE